MKINKIINPIPRSNKANKHSGRRPLPKAVRPKKSIIKMVQKSLQAKLVNTSKNYRKLVHFTRFTNLNYKYIYILIYIFIGDMVDVFSGWSSDIIILYIYIFIYLYIIL